MELLKLILSIFSLYPAEPQTPFSVHSMEPQEIAQASAIEQLPDEIKQKIILYLTSADDLQEAAKDIKNLFKTKSFAHFANDPQTNELLIQDLVKRFTNGNSFKAAFNAARELNTKAAAETAAQYVARTIKNDEDATKISKILIKKMKLYTLLKNNRRLILTNFLCKISKYTQFSFINKQNKYGQTPLIALIIKNGHASRLQKKEVIQQLLEADADVNIQDNNGDTALILAAYVSGYKKIIQLLLDKGVKINIQNIYGNTALMMAARWSCKKKIIQQLLEAGADVNIQDNGGRTALRFAKDSIQPNKQKIIDLLKQAGATQ